MEVGAFWITQMTVLSVVFIFLVHSLIQYFQSTLTIPKTHVKPQHIFVPQQLAAAAAAVAATTDDSGDDLEAMRNELLSYIG